MFLVRPDDAACELYLCGNLTRSAAWYQCPLLIRATPLFLQPNGRFELNKKICLSISAYHPEYWRPSWSSMSR